MNQATFESLDLARALARALRRLEPRNAAVLRLCATCERLPSAEDLAAALAAVRPVLDTHGVDRDVPIPRLAERLRTHQRAVGAAERTMGYLTEARAAVERAQEGHRAAHEHERAAYADLPASARVLA